MCDVLILDMEILEGFCKAAYYGCEPHVDKVMPRIHKLYKADAPSDDGNTSGYQIIVTDTPLPSPTLEHLYFKLLATMGIRRICRAQTIR